MDTVRDEEKPLHIVMFPWLAFGHMIPYLELAKLIAQKGHQVSYVSTPRNIQRLPKLPPNVAPLIKFVSLPMPKADNLPENAEATTDIPYDVVPHLKNAFDKLEQPFTHFLESSNVDWILHDFAPFWLGSVASQLGIKCVFFSIFTPPFMGFMGPGSVLLGNNPVRTKPEDFIVSPPWVPFQTIVAYRYFEIIKIMDILSDKVSGISDVHRYGLSIQNSDFILIRGCTEFEPEWFTVIKNIHQKTVFPAGQLPSTEFDNGHENYKWSWMKEWLDKQPHGTVVYVAFGSEAKPTQEEVNEIALGLEKSKLPFFWVLRVRRGPTDKVVLQLPEGFEERTKGHGVVCTDWAPQMKILGHVAVGGFLTHAGWTSVVEAVQNEKPLVLLTYLADQGINSRVLEEKKIGYSVPRDERDGSFTSDSVAHSIRLVLVEEEGMIYRENIKNMKDLFVNIERQDKYVTNLLSHLTSLLKH